MREFISLENIHVVFRRNPDLTVGKMHEMFKTQTGISVSYAMYYKVFTTKFNLKFGLPRTDTCVTCDEIRCKIDAECDPTKKAQMVMERSLHQARADKFYELKRSYKASALATDKVFWISFD